MNPSESPDDRLLREWLARETPQPLPGAGFTRRVLAALPPRPKRDWRAIAGLASGAAVGLSWSLWNGARIATVTDLATRAADWVGRNPLPTFGVAVGIVIIFYLDGADEEVRTNTRTRFGLSRS